MNDWRSSKFASTITRGIVWSKPPPPPQWLETFLFTPLCLRICYASLTSLPPFLSSPLLNCNMLSPGKIFFPRSAESGSKDKKLQICYCYCLTSSWLIATSHFFLTYLNLFWIVLFLYDFMYNTLTTRPTSLITEPCIERSRTPRSLQDFQTCRVILGTPNQPHLTNSVWIATSVECQSLFSVIRIFQTHTRVWNCMLHTPA